MTSGNYTCNFAAALTTLLCAGPVMSQQRTFMDVENDAVFRSTTGNGMPLAPTPIDLVSVTVGGWHANAPATNAYVGFFSDWEDQHLFRVDLVVSGLVNPPGRVTVGEYNPTQFGPNPLFAYIDLDIDDRKDTGGELFGAASFRYLANVGRFGRRPYGSLGERAAAGDGEIDGVFNSDPQYERSGADFSFLLCGCTNISLLGGDTNSNGIFDANETWLVRGRLFERAKGYVGASSMSGGSAFGLYDPFVDVQFSHSTLANQTTVSVVWALDQIGSKNLLGLPSVPPINTLVSDATSIAEGLEDLIDAANAGGLQFPETFTLTRKWEGRDVEEYLDPLDWEATAIIGTGFTSPEPELYAWTDTGFYESHGDLDGDAFVSTVDEALIRDHVYARDGTIDDADGTKNGRVQLANPGQNWSMFDVDSNGFIEPDDLWEYGHRADVDGSGVLNILDFITFGDLYALLDPVADFNFDEVINILDYISFGDAFAQ